MKKTISILTATRAEYGLLKSIIQKLLEKNTFDVKVVATGAHLSPEFGLTYKEIEKDGIEIDEKIEILLSSDTKSSVSKSMGLAMISFSEYFNRINPDLLIILGDRYEAFAVASVAMVHNIPIAHLHGGETTEGAIDEAIRHSISKMSYIHFASTEEYKNRIIQLGENPDRVFNVGALGVENIKNEKLISKKELFDFLNIKDLNKKYAVGTFHPVTLETQSTEQQAKNVLDACLEFEDIIFIFTKANADTNGRIINDLLEEYSSKYANIKVYTSLGMVRYLSALKYAEFVIGNSSSGLLEVPSFNIPTVNIGNRQKGRVQSETVINCKTIKEDIIESIKKALSTDFRDKIKKSKNPYEGNNTSDKIVSKIESILDNKKIELSKKFFDILEK